MLEAQIRAELLQNIEATVSAELPQRVEAAVSAEFAGSFTMFPDGAPVYEGSYEATPSFEEQALETTGKLMEADVIVHPITVSRVSNTAGGKTIYIGGI